jgi:hypothetical protein
MGKRLLDAGYMNLTYIPVGESLELPSGTAVPLSIIEHFIREAGHHVAVVISGCSGLLGAHESEPRLWRSIPYR